MNHPCSITYDKLECIQISCGDDHTVGLTKNDNVFTWGCNPFGLGHGDNEDRRVPTKVASLDGLVTTKISSSDHHHMAALTGKKETLTWHDHETDS